jgi:hypothetical protein
MTGMHNDQAYTAAGWLYETCRAASNAATDAILMIIPTVTVTLTTVTVMINETAALPVNRCTCI